MTKSEITQTPRFLIKGCLSFESTAMFVNCALAAMESTLERRHQFKFDKVLTFMASAAAASDICGKSCDHIIPPAETTSIFKIHPAFKMSFHTWSLSRNYRKQDNFPSRASFFHQLYTSQLKQNSQAESHVYFSFDKSFVHRL